MLADAGRPRAQLVLGNELFRPRLRPDPGEAYIVTMKGGSHPLVSETQSWVMLQNEPRPSHDGLWHGCASLYMNAKGRQKLLCLYAPISY